MVLLLRQTFLNRMLTIAIYIFIPSGKEFLLELQRVVHPNNAAVHEAGLWQDAHWLQYVLYWTVVLSDSAQVNSSQVNVYVAERCFLADCSFRLPAVQSGGEGRVTGETPVWPGPHQLPQLLEGGVTAIHVQFPRQGDLHQRWDRRHYHTWNRNQSAHQSSKHVRFLWCAEISQETAVNPVDIVSTLQSLQMLKYWKGKHLVLKRQVRRLWTQNSSTDHATEIHSCFCCCLHF